ncbi:unnamed protein product, partial [Ixodes hexagonus]
NNRPLSQKKLTKLESIRPHKHLSLSSEQIVKARCANKASHPQKHDKKKSKQKQRQLRGSRDTKYRKSKEGETPSRCLFSVQGVPRGPSYRAPAGAHKGRNVKHLHASV